MTIAGRGIWLPAGGYTAQQAQENGAVSAVDSWSEGIELLPTSHDVTPPQMACRAAQRALVDAGVHADQVALLVHAWVYDQGPDTWTPSHRVARELGAVRCSAVGVRQMSNGGAAALRAAVAHLLTEPRAEAALVTTADGFAGLPYDRWLPVPPLGDGGTAAVLTRGPGPEVVEAITCAGDTGLELSYPTADPFAPDAAERDRTPGPPSLATLRRIAGCVNRSVNQALQDAGLAPDDSRITAVLMPRIGRTLTNYLTHTALPASLREKSVGFGRFTGHLGSGDLIANLAEHEPPAPDTFHLHVSMGAGFTSTCVLTKGV